MIGHGPTSVSFPVVQTVAKEIEIKGSFRYVNTYDTALLIIDIIDRAKFTNLRLISQSWSYCRFCQY